MEYERLFILFNFLNWNIIFFLKEYTGCLAKFIINEGNTMSETSEQKRRISFEKDMEIINDFSITIATVNGSGSQTSNLTILRALFKMGIPVSGKNIFPSNIQGQPTWYTIRVNKDGYLARKERPEILIAMNAETFTKDYESIVPGGVLFYSEEIEQSIERDDITVYPMPVKTLVQQIDISSNLRTYVMNMVYVGVLSEMIDIDIDFIYRSLEFHFKGKQKPIDINFGMVKMAYQWAENNLIKSDPFKVQKMVASQELIMTDGNTAAALGAIYGGVHFISWYPITPATGLAESLQTYLPMLRKDPESGKNTYAVVQAEDELAAIGMAIGAGWAGLRAMTSTSGPGLSLMTEYIGLAYFAEVPVVIWDVQRIGPSTGLPTRTSQADILFAHYIGHGDTQIILLLPGTINECFEFGWRAFNIAEKFQTPVIVLSDLDFGMNQWIADVYTYPDDPIQRGKVLWEEDLDLLSGKWARYEDVDNDYIPYRTVPGNRHPHSSYFARGTGHDEMANYSEDPVEWNKLLGRLRNKYYSAQQAVPRPIIEGGNNMIGIISFGSTLPAIQEARKYLKKSGLNFDLMRIRSLPFSTEVRDFIQNHSRNYVVELNRDGQLKTLLISEYPEMGTSLISIAHIDGLPLTAEWIVNALREMENKKNGR